MKLQVAALREHLRGSLWFVPSLCVLGAFALVAATLAFDRGEHGSAVLVFTGSEESARSVLGAIASSVVTLTALVFSLTIVVLQLASSQYSPRVLRSFLRDRRSQLVLGVFLATYAYTMLVLRSVRSGGGDREEFVPELSVHVAYVLTGLSLFVFVMYIHHIARSMQASSIVAQVAEETLDAIRRQYPSVGDDATRVAAIDSNLPHPVLASRSGYLRTVDEEGLLALATSHGTVVRLLPSVGEFVPEGSRLFLVAEEVEGDALNGFLQLGRQRSMQQDPMFGLRQLVDVAEKALSPGINDPTTAVEAIDRLHEILLFVAGRSLPAPARRDERGVVRLVLPTPTWDDYVSLAFDEIRQYGEGSIQVTRRLRAMAEDLLEVVPDARRSSLRRQLELLDRSAARGFDDPEDVDRARRQGGHA